MTPARVAALIAAGILIIGAGLWVSSHRDQSASDSQTPVLPSLAPALNSVTQVRIFKGDGSRTTLVRTAAAWQVGERGYAADSGLVRKLLLDLSNLQIEEDKTTDPALYPQLGVEDVKGPKTTGTQVEVVLPATTLKLIVGKPSGEQSAYVRLAGTPQSLLASPQLAPDADPRHWLDRTLIDLPQDEVSQIEEKPESGPAYTVTRAAAAAPAAGSAPAASADFTVSNIPRGRQVQPGSAAPLAAALTDLQLDDVRKAGGMAPADRATFHTRDGLTVQVSGFKDGDRRLLTLTAGAAAATAGGRAQQLAARFTGWEFEVPAYKYDALFRPLEQLLKPLEKPAAKPGRKGTKAPLSTALPGSLPLPGAATPRSSPVPPR